MDLIIRCHVSDRVTGYDPVNITFNIFLDPHDDIRIKSVISIKMCYSRPADNIDTAAVGTCKDITCITLRHSKYLDISYA